MKVSDFKFAEFFIRGICGANGCPFVDVPVEFSAHGDGPRFVGGNIVVAATDKLSKTLFQIVAAYLQNMDAIGGVKVDLTREDRIIIINTTAALVRDMTYSTRGFPDAVTKKSVVLSLNRDPFCWAVMKSIICPSFDKPLKNVRIIARRSSLMDGAKYLTSGDVASNNPDIFPFVFSNLEIENQPCRSAYLLYEMIRAHEMDPRGVIHEVFNKQELWDRFLGIAKAAWRDDDSINDFLTTLSIIADEMDSVDKRLVRKKEAKWTAKAGLWSQAQYNTTPTSWWYLGLIERLLEPARGSDWSGYYTMKPFTDELWEKIETEKKRRGMKELPMELLLRIQGDEFKSQPDLIIQGLLADNRVW